MTQSDYDKIITNLCKLNIFARQIANATDDSGQTCAIDCMVHVIEEATKTLKKYNPAGKAKIS